MYPSLMNKPAFLTNSANSSFGASNSTFGQPSANNSMFSSNTSTFPAGPTAQTGFAKPHGSAPSRSPTKGSPSKDKTLKRRAPKHKVDALVPPLDLSQDDDQEAADSSKVAKIEEEFKNSKIYYDFGDDDIDPRFMFGNEVVDIDAPSPIVIKKKTEEKKNVVQADVEVHFPFPIKNIKPKKEPPPPQPPANYLPFLKDSPAGTSKDDSNIETISTPLFNLKYSAGKKSSPAKSHAIPGTSKDTDYYIDTNDRVASYIAKKSPPAGLSQSKKSPSVSPSGSPPEEKVHPLKKTASNTTINLSTPRLPVHLLCHDIPIPRPRVPITTSVAAAPAAPDLIPAHFQFTPPVSARKTTSFAQSTPRVTQPVFAPTPTTTVSMPFAMPADLTPRVFTFNAPVSPIPVTRAMNVQPPPPPPNPFNQGFNAFHASARQFVVPPSLPCPPAPEPPNPFFQVTAPMETCQDIGMDIEPEPEFNNATFVPAPFGTQGPVLMPAPFSQPFQQMPAPFSQQVPQGFNPTPQIFGQQFPQMPACFPQQAPDNAARFNIGTGSANNSPRRMLTARRSLQNSPPSPVQGGSTLFGGQQPQPSTSGLFGSNNAFGQNKTTYGFGTAPAQPALFGQQPQQPQQAANSLFPSTATNLFGANAFGGTTNQTSGTVIKFSPVTGSDTMQRNGVTQSISTKHHCITCMKEYEGKSLEELRFEDYSVSRKGPQQQTGFGATPFGGATNTAAAPLFGQTDNKQAFGQQQTGFGQTPAFGQTSTAFGVAPQPTTNLFGKTNTFGATTSTTPTFGFNTTPSTFSVAQPQKPFSSQPLFSGTTQAQPTFGTGVFGQTNTQNNTTNLFNKPAQPAVGFPNQTGFAFNQPAPTQTTNLFQVSKPSTGFGIFGQTNTAPVFGIGNQFGKPQVQATTFTQPAQTGFMGAPIAKPPVFSNMSSGGGIFNNNAFQQPQSSFTLNVAPQQPAQFPPEPVVENKSLPLIASDLFSLGSQVEGLEPSTGDVTATNPKDLKALLDVSKKDLASSAVKIKVVVAKTPKGGNVSKDFFETNQALRGSHKCLVIRKFNESKTTVFAKYRNELIAEAEECLKGENTENTVNEASPEPEAETAVEADSVDESPRNESIVSESIAPDIEFSETLSEYKSKLGGVKLTFESTNSEYSQDISPRSNISGDSGFVPLPGSSRLSTDRTDRSRIPTGLHSTAIDEEDVSEFDTIGDHVDENPAGVILTRPDYYMYPSLKDLHQFMDENGECIVAGLTIGRRTFGSVYFPEPINITNMNLDELIFFRHKEVVVYPDETKKPPIGEGLNRKAQVTLERIFPKEYDCEDYVTSLPRLTQSNFLDNLKRITARHKCKFIDYRPKGGSWVFKVKHFSKYGLTEKDEEECRLGKTILEEDEDEQEQVFKPIEMSPPESKVKKDKCVQSVKSSLFINLDEDMEELNEGDDEFSMLGDVVMAPRVHKLPDISLAILPEKVTTTQRVYSDLGVYNFNTFKVGFGKGFHFYYTEIVAEKELVVSLNQFQVCTETHNSYNEMMPNLTNLLKITLEESEFNFDDHFTPTLSVKKDLSFLDKQTKIFTEHAKSRGLTGRSKYLSSVWNLCTALWGKSDGCYFTRRQNVSDWLEQFSYDLTEEWAETDRPNLNELDNFNTIFKLLSFHKISEACDFARRNKLHRLSLLLSQMNPNGRFRYWSHKFAQTFAWKEPNIIPNEFKKIFLLLTGIPFKDEINTCERLDWLRCFGLHLWYLAPSAAPLNYVFNLYKNAFGERNYASKPKSLNSGFDGTKEYDLLYHILALFVDGTYQLSNLLHPETHTDDIMDYRLSWLLLQVFLSLKLGLLRDSEKEHLHSTFSAQLENNGEWRWAIFVLLYLENNSLKKNLIVKILDRHLTSDTDHKIEKYLVDTLKIPKQWIHEVKAAKAKASGDYYSYFQYNLYLSELQTANTVFMEHMLPELFVNEHIDYLTKFIEELEPHSKSLVQWQTQAGLIKDYLQFNEQIFSGVEPGSLAVGGMLSSILRRINSFPRKTNEQKLCVAELSKRCALLFKILHRGMDSQQFQSKFIDIIRHLVIPADIKHFELLYLISKGVQDASAIAY